MMFADVKTFIQRETSSVSVRISGLKDSRTWKKSETHGPINPVHTPEGSLVMYFHL